MTAIGTTDRITFKQCRRKWDWSSPLRQHLEPTQTQQISALWFGTGFHFALEDCHGWGRFPTPFAAFEAYVAATPLIELPSDAEELTVLARGMFEHYSKYWLPMRNEYTTLWVDGFPEVEVDFELQFDSWTYRGTFDRIVMDTYGRLWVLDYKTTKRFDTHKLDLDPQISAYSWAAREIYGRDVEGCIWMQFLKQTPESPRVLGNGGLSINRQQKTTYKVYRDALIDLFGSTPREYDEFLQFLMLQEQPEGNQFIRWDAVRRNQSYMMQIKQEILLEAQEMLNPDILIYPNPNAVTCGFCAFFQPCLAFEEGADYEWILREQFAKREGARNESWRQRIRWPDDKVPPPHPHCRKQMYM